MDPVCPIREPRHPPRGPERVRPQPAEPRKPQPAIEPRPLPILGVERGEIRSPSVLRKAIVLAEILAPPVALRDAPGAGREA